MCHFINYDKTVLKNHLIPQTNIFNVNYINKNLNIALISVFNTFGSEKNIKLISLYLLLFYVANQRPFIKKVKFNYIKKKILKRFFLIVSLNKKNLRNFFMYLIKFYSYFFQIYYQKNFKYNFYGNNLTLHLDNIQFFFRNYNKQNHKTQIKAVFYSRFYTQNLLFKYLNNIFLLQLKN
jgi:hypothetical protein